MKKLIITGLFLISTSASAEFLNGNKLLSLMNGTDSEQVQALMYVAGAADSGFGITTCPPEAVTLRQVYDITKKLLEKVPEHRHKAADSFVTTAMNIVWPCKKTSTPESKPKAISI